MTFLEKLKEDNQTFTSDAGDCPNFCPSEIGLENVDCKGGRCLDCWNREMPNTETKAEILKEVHEHFGTEEADISYVEGLEHGRNEAWELAKKITNFTCEERDRKLGIYQMHSIFECLTPQEAIAKLKAYEEAQIEVGDVVKSTLYVDMNCGVVANITDDKASLVHKDGKFSVMVPLEFLVKTGKHLELASILEQIGE
jgi:hypothetical protein